MADNTINIKVKIDDKGNLSVLGKKAKAAGEGLERTAKGAQTADRNLKGAARTSSNTTKNFSKMAQGINGGLVPAYATLAANIFAISAAFQFLKDAGNLVALQRGQEAYAASTGIALRSIANDIIAATDAQIGFQEASQAAAIGTASGLGTDQLNALAEGAKNVSIILGRDVTDSFNRLIRGVTKAEPELLDELGIILRLDRATSNYAQTINKSAKEFTEFERSQAVAAEVITQLEDKYNRIAAATELSVNKFNQLGKAFDDITNKIKEFAATGLTPLAQAIVESPTLGIALMGLFAKGIITAALPAIGSFAFASNEALENARTKANAARQAMEQLGNTTDRAAGAAAAASRAQDAAANAPLKGRAISALAEGKGEKLTSRQVSGLLTQVKRSEKLKQAEFKKTKQILVTELEIMLAATRRTNADMTRVYKTSATLAQRAWTTAVTGIRVALSGLATAANFAATALSRIFAFAGYVALAVSLFEIVKGYIGFKKSAEETTDELALQEKQLELSTKKLEELNQQFADFVAVQSILTEDGGGALQFFTALGNQITSLSSSFFQLSAKNSIPAFSDYTKSVGGELEELNKKLKLFNDTVDRQRKAGLSESFIAADSGARVAKLTEEIASLDKTYLEFLLSSEKPELLQFGQRIDGLQQSFKLLTERFGRGPRQIREFADALAVFSDSEATIEEQAAALETIQEKYKGVSIEVGRLNNLQRLTNENSRQFVSILQSLGKETQATQLLKTQKQEFEELNDLSLGLYYRELDRILILEKEIAFTERLVNVERDREKRDAALQLAKENGLRNTTSLQRAILQDQFKLQELLNQELFINDQIFLLEQQKADNADTFSEQQQHTLDLYKQQLLLLDAQKETILDNTDATQQLLNSFNESFTQGFQKGLTDIISGKERSLKDAIGNLAKGVLNSLSESLSKSFTQMLFGKKDPATRFAEAGEYVAGLISNAVQGVAPVAGGFSSGVSGGIGGLANLILGKKTLASTGGTSQGGVSQLLGMQSIRSGGLMGLLGNLAGFFGFANGGIMKGGFRGYANGGIIKKPTVGLVGEGRYNEAVVPLPDGKSIPVQMGGAGQNNNVTVNVAIDNQGNASSDVTQNGQGADIGRAVARAVQLELQNQKRSGGILNPYGVA